MECEYLESLWRPSERSRWRPVYLHGHEYLDGDLYAVHVSTPVTGRGRRRRRRRCNSSSCSEQSTYSIRSRSLHYLKRLKDPRLCWWGSFFWLVATLARCTVGLSTPHKRSYVRLWSRREDLNTPSAEYNSAALTLSYTGTKFA